MNPKITLATFLFALILFSCKNENSFTDYKYADQPTLINCDGLNSKLYNEALYSFENDMINYYRRARPNTTLFQAYSQYLRSALYSTVKYEDIISKHTLDVFEALKNETDLWNTNNPKSNLNYNSSAVSCISKNIQDKDLKTTFNALLTTNSMSPKLFGAPLSAKLRDTQNDKYLALYTALDLFYANLFGIDFSAVDLNKPIQNVDFNNLPKP